MLKYYLKYALRNFKSNRLIFAGSIATVFLGAICISLLSSYIHNELSMDNFHEREKDIYLITVQPSPESQIEAIDASLFFGFNYKDYPGIENLTNVKKYEKGEIVFKYGESSISTEGIVADSSFFEFFDFGLIIGDESTVLHDPDAILFTENFAKRMFGNENPIGKVVKMTGRYERNYTVKGILEPIPPNSSILFDYILPVHSSKFSRSGANFILTDNGFARNDFVEKIKTLGHKHVQFKESRMSVMALNDVYFEGSGANLRKIFTKFGNKKSINILYAIIAVIFIITLLNFSNLQVISINSSIKNIGINKISGARRGHIFYQKMTELFVLILFSALLISVVFIAVLPYFNRVVGVGLSPNGGQIFLLNFSILVLLVVSAMVYPTIVILRISITNSLKSQILSGNNLVGRNIVSTVQFSLSLILLIASIVVAKQLNLMLNHDLGFSSKNVITTRLFHEPHWEGTREEQMEQHKNYQKSHQVTHNELASNSSIKIFSQGLSPIKPFTMPWKLEGSDRDFATTNCLSVTPDYLNTLGLQIAEGRFFEKERDISRGKQVVINEAAKKFFGIEDISNAKILSKYWSFEKDGYEIIGVVKNFNSNHLSVTPQPLLMLYFDDIDQNYLIQFEEGATSGLQFVKKLFDDLNPGETFEYTFLSDDIKALYQKEKRLSEIYILFTIIGFAISAIGLLAISIYDTRRRTKEIGIRKVNGATIAEILLLLNKDFVKWVAIAFVIATPIAWYAMHKWLQNFAYKTELSWWIFALAGLLALGIALLTVSWQSWRAAVRNPVEALRYE
jgi:putative ABC transport system permease protein